MSYINESLSDNCVFLSAVFSSPVEVLILFLVLSKLLKQLPNYKYIFSRKFNCEFKSKMSIFNYDLRRAPFLFTR